MGLMMPTPQEARSGSAFCSVSSAGPEAAAPCPGWVCEACPPGRGDRARTATLHAEGRYTLPAAGGVGFSTPPAAPRRADAFFCVSDPSINLIQGTKVRQPVTARLSAKIKGPKIDCSVPMAMGLKPQDSGWWFRMKMDIYRRSAAVQKGGRRVSTW